MQNQSENGSRNLLALILFEILIFVQIGLILYAVYTENYWLIYGVILVGMAWAFYLLKKWNIDERTNSAIDDASRTAIQIFILIIIPVGLGFIIYSQFSESVLWEAGATLILAGLVLFSLHVLLTAYYEDKMR